MQAFREITPLSEDDVFVLLDSINNGFDYPLHLHPEYELTLIMGSSGTRIIGDSVEKYEDWDLALVGPYLVHKWDGDDKPFNDDTPCRVLTLQFAMHAFDHPFFSKPAFYQMKKMLESSKQGIRFKASVFKKAKKLMIRLTKSKGLNSVVTFFKLMDCLSQTDDFEYLATEGFSEQVLPTSSSRLQVVNAFILKNFPNPSLRMSDVAQQINMTNSAFSHFFKKCTNRSFTEFLIDVRLGYASKLLIDTDQLVSNIAFSSGFYNITNFNRAFKKHFDKTPVQFRKLFQEKRQFDTDNQRTPGQFLSKTQAKNPYPKPKTYATKLKHS